MLEMPKSPYRYIVVTDGTVSVPDTFAERVRKHPNVVVTYMSIEDYKRNEGLLGYGTQRIVRLVGITDPDLVRIKQHSTSSVTTVVTKALVLYSDSLAERSGMVLPLGVELDIVFKRANDQHGPSPTAQITQIVSPEFINPQPDEDNVGYITQLTPNGEIADPYQLLDTQLGRKLLNSQEQLDTGAKLTWQELQEMTRTPQLFRPTSHASGSEHDAILQVITAIRESHPDMVELYTRGQCYNFYKILAAVFPQAECYYDPIDGHVITKLGTRYYDITGEVIVVRPETGPIAEVGSSDSPELWGGRDTRRLVETVRHVGGELYEFTYVKMYDNETQSAERRFQVPASNLFNALARLGQEHSDRDKDVGFTLDVTSFKKVR